MAEDNPLRRHGRLRQSTGPYGLPDNATFYTGPLIWPDLTYHDVLFVGTPIFYDPTKGDLLLNIEHPLCSNDTRWIADCVWQRAINR